MIKYNSEDSIKLFNFVKNNFEWNSIKMWQDSENEPFPEKIKKKIDKDEIIKEMLNYPIKFDIENKDINHTVLYIK